jgi:hypothetical protein
VLAHSSQYIEICGQIALELEAKVAAAQWNFGQTINPTK